MNKELRLTAEEIRATHDKERGLAESERIIANAATDKVLRQISEGEQPPLVKCDLGLCLQGCHEIQRNADMLWHNSHEAQKVQQKIQDTQVEVIDFNKVGKPIMKVHIVPKSAHELAEMIAGEERKRICRILVDIGYFEDEAEFFEVLLGH